MMEKLNELVALANKATSGKWIADSGEGWDAIISQQDMVNGNFIVGEFIGPDSKANKDFVLAASPENILAIADAFRELERDRDAFESNYNGEIEHRKQIANNWRKLAAASGWEDSRDQYAADNDLPRQFDSAVEMAASWKWRAEAAEAKLAEKSRRITVLREQRDAEIINRNEAEAKLAELNKQKPYGWLIGLPGLYPTFTLDYRNVEQAEKAGGYKITPIYRHPAPAVSLLELVPDEWGQRVDTDKEIGAESGWNDCRAEMLHRIEKIK